MAVSTVAEGREVDVVDLDSGPDQPHVDIEHLPARPVGSDAPAELLDIDVCRDLEEDHLAHLGLYGFHMDRVAEGIRDSYDATGSIERSARGEPFAASDRHRLEP